MKRKKFIVIADPSFSDNVGHYAKYDLAILNQMIKEGVGGEIWAGKSCCIKNENTRIIKLYEKDAWGKSYINDQRHEKVKKLLERIGGKLYLAAKIFFSAIGRFKNIWVKKFRVPIKSIVDNKLYKILVPALAIALLLLNAATRQIFNIYVAAYLFYVRHRSGEAKETISQIKKGLGAKENLLLFCHMITPANIIDWAVLAIYCEEKKIDLVLLFRYPTYFFDNKFSSFLAKKIYADLYRFNYVKLFTDSELLTKSYSEYFSTVFETLPIPHLPIYTKSQNKDASLVFSMLGNARTEKGFNEFCEFILENDVWLHESSVIIYLQINNPDPECEPFIERLEQKSLSFVNLIYSPLSDEEYDAIVSLTDVFVLPYHSDVYQERTSGVLFEGIASGKIALVTDGTWLAYELKKYGSGVVVKDKSSAEIWNGIDYIKRNFNSLRLLAMSRAESYKNIHGQKLFLNALIDRPRKEITAAGEVLIVFPFPDFLTQKTGASTRVGLLAKYLSEHGFSVKILVPNQIKKYPVDVELEKLITEYNYAPSELYFLHCILKSFCGWSNVSRALWYISNFFDYKNNKEFRNALIRLGSNANFIFVEYPFSISEVAMLGKRLGIKTILTFHDIMSTLDFNWLLNRKILNLEKSSFSYADSIVTISARERDLVKEFGYLSTLIPSPCNLDRADQKSPGNISNVRNFFFFVGADHLPNNNAAVWLYEFIRERKLSDQDLNMVIAGTCASINIDRGYISLGAVSNEELEYLYANTICCLMPLWGSTGVSLKTIQAMSRGKVVIGTDDAFRGLDVVNGKHCLFANTKDEFSCSVELLINNSELKASIEAEAYKFAKKYDYREIFRGYLPLIDA